MIRNYIKIAIRNMARSAVYSIINIAGLSVGLIAFIFIFLWVQHELSYDRFHERADQLYRVVENQHYVNSETYPVAVTPGPLSPYLKENFPEVENSARLGFAQFLFQYNDLSFNESGILADPSFFEMFSFPAVKGDAKKFLSGIDNIVINERLANKYFPGANPLGKVFKIHDTDFVVTGVIDNVPQHSHIQFDYVLPFELFVKFGFDSLNQWTENSHYTYVQLGEGVSAAHLNTKIRDIIKSHAAESTAEVYLQPLTSIHLHSKFTADIDGNGDIQYVYIFVAAALFVLLIACINFMNLSTARSIRRSKEVGIRKVVGAGQMQLIRQFLTESVLLTFLALIVALIFVALLLPLFNTIAGKQLGLTLSAQMLAMLTFIMLFTGLVAGSYPALFMSSFKPVSILKGTLKTGNGVVTFRRVLVITQFTVSALLISATIVVYHQLGFIRSKKLGFDKENVLSFQAGGLRESFQTFRNELLAMPGIDGVTIASNHLRYVGNSGNEMDWEGKHPDDNVLIHMLSVDPDFIKTFNIELAAGRDFSQGRDMDSTTVILNEEAIRQMGLENPINKRFSLGNGPCTIIGVVKDFHFKSVREKIEPLVMFINARWLNQVYVKLKPNDLARNIAAVESVYKKFNPENAFEYSFLNDDFDNLYRAEQRTGKIFNGFALVAIFISCLGLFGLVMFTTEQRTKEIGIRKVLGASVGNLFSLISVDFLKLIVISNVIALPLAWYAMDQWLSGFAYRININWVTFIIAAALSVIIAWITLSYQSIKAAMANPVDSLRSE